MSFDWQTYLRLAQWLTTTPIPIELREAAMRTVISRAYYAAFSSAARFLVSNRELTLTGLGEDHWRVIKHFHQSKDPTRTKIGLLLTYLREDRNKADYDDQFGNLDHNAQLATGRAESILRLLKTLA